MQKLLLKKKNQGFTLIELMIVVAIIGILAAIAIPNFIRYQLRSKQAEGKTNVRSIKVAQEGFRATEDFYLGSAVAVPVNPGGAVTPTKRPWLDVTCPAGCNRTVAGQALCNSFNCIGYKSDGPVYFNYETTAIGGAAGVEPEFCVAAQADLDGDGTVSSFEYQSINATGATAGVAPDCAIGVLGLCGGSTIPDGEIILCQQGVY